VTRNEGDEPRWVCFDVGETLIEESRIWGAWADELNVPRLTFFAALGGAIVRGLEHGEVLERFGGPHWRSRIPAVDAAYGGFRAEDLYPDALPTLERVRTLGYRVAVVANQPATRREELVALGVQADLVAMSEEVGAAKPSPAFFERLLELAGVVDPRLIAYVGDRVDNDVLPAIAAGMRAVWLRRGPWGVLQELPPDVEPALVLDSLSELPDRLDELWDLARARPDIVR
jgi:HAD superfamily hydrolase (TIGR01549 family)